MARPYERAPLKRLGLDTLMTAPAALNGSARTPRPALPRVLVYAFALAACALAFGASHDAVAAPLLKWRVENPFRLFTEPADTEMHRATYRALSAAERATPVLSSERHLQTRPGHADGWAATMYRKTCWDWKNNRYSCPDYEDYINPKSHRVIAELAGLDEAPDVTCTWATAPRGGDELRGKVVSQPCNEPFVIDVPYPSGADVKVEIGGREIAQSRIAVQDILVVRCV